MTRSLLALVIVLVASFVEAKTLYVNNSGSPACSNATPYASNDAANPWCLIGRAAWGSDTRSTPSTTQAAQAGDVVLITAGTYTTAGNSSPDRFDVALNPANSGTNGNPITFRGVGTVTIRTTAGGHRGPTIGADSKDYIVWDHIAIDDTYNGSVGGTGPVVFHVSTGSQLINSTIQGHNGSYDDGHATFANNYAAVYLEVTNSVRVSNNYISRVHNGNTGIGSGNEAGIMTYDAASSIFEHNTISDVGTGIYVKGEHEGDGWPSENNVVRFNRISECDANGVGLLYAYGTKLYQNIIKSATVGVLFYNFGPTTNDDITIQNNTFVSTNISFDNALRWQGVSNIDNVRVYNNIVYGSFFIGVHFEASGRGNNTFEHNVYFGYNDFSYIFPSYRNFTYWQGTELQDSASPAGVNSDPLFVNEVDYKLTGSSPGKNLGVDILDLDGDLSTSDAVDAGAYITGSETIGVEGVTGNHRFSPALNLRIAQVEP